MRHTFDRSKVLWGHAFPGRVVKDPSEIDIPGHDTPSHVASSEHEVEYTEYFYVSKFNELATAAANAPAEYKTETFQCLGDYQKCRASENHIFACGGLMTICLADKIVGLVKPFKD